MGNGAGRIWLCEFRKNAECNSGQKWGPLQTLTPGRTLRNSLDVSVLVSPSASAFCKHQIPFLVWLKRWSRANPGAHLGICEIILSRPASFRNAYLPSIKQTANKQKPLLSALFLQAATRVDDVRKDGGEISTQLQVGKGHRGAVFVRGYMATSLQQDLLLFLQKLCLSCQFPLVKFSL